ncbi:hypothetical protein JY97_05280 [Alkalispirochaeta odontotermitis]|nr:hypothetical protein JY97_05280 [Alkalispirochaeta odontotermitis]
MRPILLRLAQKKNGTLDSSGLFLMPKLRFYHSGTKVEVSVAATGIAGNSVHYTYTAFTGLDLKGFEFRILPKSLQTIGDKWLMQKKPMSTGVDKLDKYLAIYTNNDPLQKSARRRIRLHWLPLLDPFEKEKVDRANMAVGLTVRYCGTRVKA